MVLNLPTWLSLGRIAAVPVVVALILLQATDADGPALRWAAVALFAAASITDYFDGYLARAWNQVTALGRCLDPIADKLLVAGVLVCLVAIDRASTIATILILSREIFISGLREVVASLPRIEGAALPVTWVAKWKTAVQMTALAVLILGDLPGLPLTAIGEALLWLAVALTLWSGYGYTRRGVGQLLANDAAAKAPSGR